MNKTGIISSCCLLSIALFAFWGGAQENTLQNNSPESLGRLVARNVMKRPAGYDAALNLIRGPVDINYEMACSRYGVLIFAEAVNDKELLNDVVKAYEPFLTGKRKPRKGIVDYNVFGIVPFELYRQTRNEKYLAVARRLADDEFKKTKTDGISRYSRFWVDDMYMVGSLQTQAYKATGERVYAERAINQILAYCKEIQHSNGLFQHNLRSPYFWGRGNGWAAASMTELLSALPEDYPRRPAVMESYRKLMEGVIKCQDSGGMWHQLLDEPNSYLESSVSGMFVFALATGARKNWLPRSPYEEAAQRGWKALSTYVDAEGNVREVCIGTGAMNSKRHYLKRPRKSGDLHGQAAFLWAAAAMHSK